MATASSFDGKMFCCLCLDVFENPRFIFCGHSFCSKCLQDYINKNHQNSKNEISCPLCRQNLQIPDITKPVETWAGQFPINIALQEAISQLERSVTAGKGGYISQLTSITDSLKTFREILQSDMDEKIEKLRQDVDINVVEITEEVRRIGNTLISNCTAAVHKEQNRLIREIEKCQNFVNSEIDKLFTEHKHLIQENEKLIKLGEDLLKHKSESDIKINISKFNKLQNTTSEFLVRSVSKSEESEFKINFIKSQKKKKMSVHIGEISTNIQTDVQTDRLTDTLKHTDVINPETQCTDTINTTTQQSDTQINRQTDTLERTFTINTRTFFDSFLVSGEDNSKIVVSDYENECVKCFCLETKSVINKYVTSSPPRGLAESRDQQVVVLVCALPDEYKILFLNLENFKLINTVTTDKRYWYIAVLPDNRLAVTGHISGQYLDILTDSGQLINSISADLIPEPSRLTVHDQCLIVVSDENSLFCVTSSGDVKWESRDSERLRKVTDVTCDGEGNIFVCSGSRVVQLSRDGQVVRDVLTRHDGQRRSFSVCCYGNKLWVGQRKGKIQMFTWCEK